MSANYEEQIGKALHQIIARHDGLHGITHNVMGGKMLSEEHCRNCRETAESLEALISNISIQSRKETLEEANAEKRCGCHVCDWIGDELAQAKAQLKETK